MTCKALDPTSCLTCCVAKSGEALPGSIGDNDPEPVKKLRDYILTESLQILIDMTL